MSQSRNIYIEKILERKRPQIDMSQSAIVPTMQIAKSAIDKGTKLQISCTPLKQQA